MFSQHPWDSNQSPRDICSLCWPGHTWSRWWSSGTTPEMIKLKWWKNGASLGEQYPRILKKKKRNMLQTYSYLNLKSIWKLTKKTHDVSKTNGILSMSCKGLTTLRIPGMHHPGGRNGKVLPKLCCCGHRRLSAKRQVFCKWALQMLKSWDNSSENRSCSIASNHFSLKMTFCSFPLLYLFTSFPPFWVSLAPSMSSEITSRS